MVKRVRTSRDLQKKIDLGIKEGIYSAAELDRDILELEKLLEEESYQLAEKSLYEFFKLAWNWYDPNPLVDNWHLECMCEHVQAALNREIRRLIISISPRCLEENTGILLLNNKTKKIKDILIGDVVISIDLTTNKPVEGIVTDVINNGKRQVYRLTLENGKYLEATSNHRLLTSEGYKYVYELELNTVSNCSYISLFDDFKNRYFQKIIDISYLGYKNVYDISVEKYENFTLANGIHSHNSSKSTVSSISAVTWQLLRKPEEKFWLISHSNKLFMQNIVYARRILDHPGYKNRWLDPKSDNYKYSLTKDQNTKTRIETSQGGYILGGSPESGALGMGYTVAILDDILDSQESNNPDIIEKINLWYTQTFMNRSNDVNTDVVIIPMQRLASCFLPNTLVKTDSGLKQIQHLTYKDKVFTSNHKYEPILNISKKTINPNIVKIGLKGFPYKLNVTEDHKIKIYDRKTKIYNWITAKEVKPGTITVLPIRYKQSEVDFKFLWEEHLTRKNYKFKYTGGCVDYSKVKNPCVTKEKILDAFECVGNHIQKAAKLLGVHRNTLANYLKFYNLDYLANKFNIIPLEALNTEEFWRVVGLWVAEGSLNKNVVQWAFHSDEIEYMTAIKNFASKYNVHCKITKRKEAKCSTVIISSKQLADFLRQNFKELAENKVIPDWLFDLDDKYVQSFLLGYIQGDGTIRGYLTTVGTVSKNLAEGVYNLFLRLQIPCYLTVTVSKQLTRLPMWEVHVHNYFVRDWVYKQDRYLDDTNCRKPVFLHNVFSDCGKYFLIKVKDVKLTTDNTEHVWDITTPTGDFVAEGILVHNSDITGYVMKEYADQGWFQLIIPAKYDPDRTFISPIGFNDKRTKRNELMDPVRLPDSFLETQAKNKVVYNTRYQQNPDALTDGNMIEGEWIVETDKIPHKFDALLTVWDLSFADDPESSYSVGLVMGKHEDKIYIFDMYRKRMNAPQQTDAVRKMKSKYKDSQIGIEKRANGSAVMSFLEREIHNIYAFQPRLFGGSKEQRLNACLTYFRDKRVLIYSPFEVDDTLESTYSAETIKKELLQFPIGEHDDIVDCVSYGVQYLMEFGQEGLAIITNGEKIILSEEDINMREWLKTGKSSILSSSDIDFTNSDDIFSSMPTRDYILDIF